MRSPEEIKEFLQTIDPSSLPDGEDVTSWIVRHPCLTRYIVDAAVHSKTKVYYYNYTTEEFFEGEVLLDLLKWEDEGIDCKVLSVQVQTEPCKVVLSFTSGFLEDCSLIDKGMNHIVLYTSEQDEFFAIYLDYSTEDVGEPKEEPERVWEPSDDEAEVARDSFGEMCYAVADWINAQDAPISEIKFTVEGDGKIRVETTMRQQLDC